MTITIEARYTIANVTGQRDVHGLTFYEACKALEAAAQQGALQDTTMVRRDADSRHLRGRCVAFWCLWRNEVRPFASALQQERNALGLAA